MECSNETPPFRTCWELAFYPQLISYALATLFGGPRHMRQFIDFEYKKNHTTRIPPQSTYFAGFFIVLITG